ncbi:hypothetical protein X760_22530 [Mesorhizobium sp. LSHC422A00]|nr:hypothetical protein [Mesorhizobium sp. LSHC416B00]ESX46833.1 hypothetical protein X762_20400 [Mesorhizobium sp. LSHC426A00]ESX56770.1 hypothetical protein X760_22530 [Mesorhizobium sp. LSHC422A00]ESX58520.1 hypothetical protein X761_00725 [Mesorhizobium sp. LSHC424B00]ESZ02412.1 hypothetical protein X736_30075 [Mesorhizobium sp. L2C089B000]ESZ38857.1 hypothetical protein X731_28410 [Mesorhizobium sp. L2C054A000]
MDVYVEGKGPEGEAGTPFRISLEPSYRHRDALRLLFILVAGSEDVDRPTEEVVSVFRAEKRLMAMDFLVRYPDYLGDALLDLYEETREPELLEAVQRIFINDEPSIRLVRMVRWRHGAYQNVEDALAMLSYYGLARPMQLAGDDGKIRRYEYLILPKAISFLEKCVQDYPELAWYRDRLALVMRVASGKSGSALKEWQYEHPQYGSTIQGDVIPTIQEQVEQRLTKFAGLEP